MTDDAVNGIGDDINLGAHVTGNPTPGNGLNGSGITAGHTWLIIVVALVILWLLGGIVFKGIRM